jgi:hypothetical protein
MNTFLNIIKAIPLRVRLVISAVFFLLLIMWFLTFVPKPTPSVLPELSKYNAKPLPLSTDTGIYLSSNAMYFENGHSIVRLKDNKTTQISQNLILPTIDNLYVSNDEKSAFFRSVDFSAIDITSSDAEKYNLYSGDSYWWSIDLTTNKLTLLTTGNTPNTPLEATSVSYDPQSSKLCATDIEGIVYVYHGVNTESYIQPKISSTYMFTLASLIGNKLVGYSKTNEVITGNISDNSLVSTSSILQQYGLVSLSPNGQYAVFTDNSNNSKIVRLFGDKKQYNIGKTYESSTLWSNNSTVAYFSIPRSSSDSLFNLSRFNTSDFTANSIVRDIKNPDTAIERLVTADSNTIVYSGNGLRTVSSKKLSFDYGTSIFSKIANDDIEITTNASSLNQYVVRKKNLNLNQDELINSTKNLLKQNGRSSDWAQTDFTAKAIDE